MQFLEVIFAWFFASNKPEEPVVLPQLGPEIIGIG